MNIHKGEKYFFIKIVPKVACGSIFRVIFLKPHCTCLPNFHFFIKKIEDRFYLGDQFDLVNCHLGPRDPPILTPRPILPGSGPTWSRYPPPK